ncbi:MAG TPA: hypothetical protein PLY16_02505, partial [Candidatus Saccharibacteria bacterium]|nr:hypothetical protein [Candidatus Saccharibacteria bacterium]
AKRLILKHGYDEKYGARPLRRAMQDILEHKIAEGILNNEYNKGTLLRATARKGEIEIHAEHEAK